MLSQYRGYVSVFCFYFCIISRSLLFKVYVLKRQDPLASQYATFVGESCGNRADFNC